MVICDTIQERNAVPDAVVTTVNSEGKHVVYQAGDVFPAELEAVINSQE